MANRLSKTQYYIVYKVIKKGTLIKETIWLLLKYVFGYYLFPFFIISDRRPQFILLIWKFIYVYLSIKPKLSMAYHPQTNK